MKRIVIFNFILLVTGWLFYQLNVSWFNAIFFHPEWSAFTRYDYMKISVILFVIVVIGFYLNHRITRDEKEVCLRKIIKFETTVFYLFLILSLVFYIFITIFPNDHFISKQAIIHANKWLVFFYVLELIIILSIIFKILNNKNKIK